MAERLYIIVEMFAITYFFHKLYGKKYRIDIFVILLIGIDLIMMTGINEQIIPAWLSYFIYPLMFLYSLMEYRQSIKKTVVNTIIGILILAFIQFISYLGMLLICWLNFPEIIQLNIISFIMLILCIVISRKFDLSVLSSYFMKREVMLKCAALLCISGVAICVYHIRIVQNGIFIEYVFWICMAIAFICIMTASWGKYKSQYIQERELLKVYQQYESSYQSILEDMRIKQHDIKNHINNIYVQSSLYDTYDELVEAQKKYCDEIIYDNRHAALLKMVNPAIAGFLYSKITEAERKGIDITYEIECSDFKSHVPVYRMIEVLGNLINNAIEALQTQEDKRMYLEIVENADEIHIEVMNISDIISWEEISRFFKKGISTKGNNRGLGLYSIKKMSKEYGFKILCSNKNHLDMNWISFQVKIEK